MSKETKNIMTPEERLVRLSDLFECLSSRVSDRIKSDYGVEFILDSAKRMSYLSNAMLKLEKRIAKTQETSPPSLY